MDKKVSNPIWRYIPWYEYDKETMKAIPQPKSETHQNYLNYLKIEPFLEPKSQMYVREELGFDEGGRVSFANGGIPKGYINLSQLGEKVGLPERIVTHPKTGRRRAIGGLRQRIIDTMTRIPSAERRNLKSKDFVDNVLVKQLDLKKVDLGQGQSTWIIKNPNKTELETMKEYFLRKGSKYGITKETVGNMKKFYNDPTLRKYIRKGEFIPDEVLAAKGIGKNQAANITFRLAQHLNGKKFANVDVDLPVNKSLAKKIFKQIEKAPFGNPYQLTAYKEAQNIITNELGSEYFDRTNLESMKREARRILNREGVPTFDPTIKGSSGFNVNEIIGIKTGARVKGLAPYSQFINIMEGKLNTAQYANFVRQFEKFNNRMQTENKSDVIKDYNKYRKTFLKNNPKLKDIDVPKFSLQSPEKIYGKNRINELAKEGLDFNKSYKEIGYTVDVGKKTRTLKEFITNPKNIARLKKFGKPGAIAAAALSVPAIAAADTGVQQADSVLPEAAAGAGAVGAYKARKPIWKGIKTAGKIAGKALAPLAVPLEAGFVLSDLKSGSSVPEALLDVVMLGGLERQRQKRNFIKNKYGDEIYSQLQSYKSFGDDGMGIPQELPERFKKIEAEANQFLQAKRAERAAEFERRSNMPMPDIDPFQAANGGLASLTRTVAPPRGPQYRGLDYLKYYGR